MNYAKSIIQDCPLLFINCKVNMYELFKLTDRLDDICQLDYNPTNETFIIGTWEGILITSDLPV